MAPSAFQTPAATASVSSMPEAVDTPSPRIEPWTFKDTALRASWAGSLHGIAAGSGSSAGPGSPEEGGPAAPALGAECVDPSARPGADPYRSPPEEVAAGHAPQGTAEARVASLWAAPEPPPLPPVKDTAAAP